MTGRVASGRIQAAQERALVGYLRRQIAPYSPRYRAVLAARPVRSFADLAALPFERVDAVVDPTTAVLRPTLEAILACPDFLLKARVRWARLLAREARFSDTVIDPIYKPIHWLVIGSLATGYSAEDVERLAESSRLQLQGAGVTPSDALVGLLDGGADLTYWALALGARRGGVPTLLLPARSTPEEVARLAPTVVAGARDDLVRLLDGLGGRAVRVRTILVTDGPVAHDDRVRLVAAAGGSAMVVGMWAPVGPRALWAECRGGVDLHLTPSTEYVEVVDPGSGERVVDGIEGELVWTPIAWKGTVLLRVRTGVTGAILGGPCPACGAEAPRVHVTGVAAPRPRRSRARPAAR